MGSVAQVRVAQAGGTLAQIPPGCETLQLYQLLFLTQLGVVQLSRLIRKSRKSKISLGGTTCVTDGTRVMHFNLKD